MTGFPITVSPSGSGVPVVNTPLGTPASVSASGIPVVIVSSGGIPLNIDGLEPPEPQTFFDQETEANGGSGTN